MNKIKYIIIIEVPLFGYLYVMDLINARKVERTKIKMELQEAG